MTSTPVKNVNQLLNFVGGSQFTKTGGMNQTGNFGDVMSRAQSDRSGSQSQNVTNKQTGKTTVAQSTRKEVVKTEKPARESVKTEDLTAKDRQMMEEAGEQIVKETAKELGVTPEEVETAMEELGLSAYSLLDPANLTQLVLQLSGEPDAAALLTDEGLFAKLQNLLDVSSQLKEGLMEEMNLSPEELQAVLETVDKSKNLTANLQPEEEMNSAADQAQESAPQITVEVKAAGEEIKMTADENGNVTGNAQVVSTGTEETVADQYADSREKESSGEKKEQSGMMHTGNQMIDALLQDKPQTAEVSMEQTPVYFDGQTQDIMNQIMDYMKIQLKPGMDQLEMQLHPASLGTVNVQLTSRGGEITAQFHVQNETVKAAIESQITTLQESFKEQGVKVQEIQVTVESHGFESNLWQGQGREENASSQNGRKTPRRINLNDLNGMFGEEASEEELLAAKMMEANGNTVDYTA